MGMRKGLPVTFVFGDGDVTQLELFRGTVCGADIDKFILNNLLILVKYYLIKYETPFAFHKLPVFHIVHPTHFAGFQIQHICTFSFDIQLCVLCLC
jgi:hypothetical protein